MKAVRVYFVVSCFAVLFSTLTGCLVIRDTTEEWRNSETALAQEGPGVSEATLCRWQNTKVDHGNRIAIGFFPWLATPKPKEDSGIMFCYGFGVCVGNVLFGGIPTVCNLIFGPFSEKVRTSEWSQLSLIGSYEWNEPEYAKVVVENENEDIIAMSESRSLSGFVFHGETRDGTKLYFYYPGNDVVKKEIASLGNVAVMFDYPVQKYRLFYSSRKFKDKYAFKDIDVGNVSVEMTQSRYYKRIETAKASVATLCSSSRLDNKAKAAIRALDALLVALPKMDETVLARLEKDVDVLTNTAKEITAEKMRVIKERELLAMRRNSAESGWRNENDLRSFALKESPALWQVVQKLRAEVKTRRESIVRLRADLKLFGKDPDNDPDCQKLVEDVDALLDSLIGIFVKLENAYIAAKKYEASPSRKDYQDTMKRALEDGIQDANMATERYKVMTRQK